MLKWFRERWRASCRRQRITFRISACIAILLLLTLFVVGIGGPVRRAWLRRLIEDKQAAMHRDGIAVAPTDMSALFPELDGPNAWDLYAEAERVRSAASRNDPVLPAPSSYIPEPGVTMPAEMWTAARNHVAANAEALVILHDAGAIDGFQSPGPRLNWVDRPISYFMTLRDNLCFLRLAASVAAANGDADIALSRLADAAAIARRMDTEPMLSSALYGFAYRNICVDTAQDVFGHIGLKGLAEVDPGLLARVADDFALTEADVRAMILFSIQTEACFFIESTNAILKEPVHYNRALCVLENDTSYIRSIAKHSLSRKLKVRFHRYVGFFHATHLAGLDYWHAAYRICRDESRTLDGIAVELRRLDASQKAAGHHVFFGDYSRVVHAFAIVLARQRVTHAGLALGLYYAREGRLPEKLSDLTPDILSEEDLTDTYGGGFLRYRRESDGGAVVWSIGPDLVDNDGVPTNERGRHASSAQHPGADIPFRLAP